MSNGQTIIELDQKRMTAMAQKDVAALKNMLCKGLVYTHSSGRQDTKQSLLDGMESGTTVYTSMVPSDVKAQDFGNVVVLTGVAAISVNSRGKPNSFRVRFTDVYENQNGTWRMVTWQSTKLPD
ncbi:MAG: nuclear transport factor 2 family protein [Betaproteobacteria bacterium]|nr:nuclear transport factor 2 family protein [Betaproteobacteria bacterium]